MRRGLVADSVRTPRGRLRYSVAVFVFMGCSPLSGLDHEVADNGRQVSAGGQKLAQGTPRGPEGVEIVNRDAVLGVGAREIGEFGGQLSNDLRIDWIVDARHGFDVTGVVADLPGVWRGYDDVTANELAPVHVVAERRGKQAETVAALAVDAIGDRKSTR